VTEPVEPSDLLIVAAFAPELVAFQALLGPAMQAQVGGLMVSARPVGIGLVSAATGTAARLAMSQPRAVVLVGTCGSYPGTQLAIGDVIVGRSILLVEPAVVDGEAAFPEPMSGKVEAHAAMSAAIGASGGRSLDIGTTLAVTTSDALAKRLGRDGRDGRDGTVSVEHLEAFAVATACAARSIPFAVVLGVANAVGSMGREQWRANHAEAGRKAGSFVARWIQAGAAGVPHKAGTL
jgi:nucleoside phosphorylase